MAKVKSVKAVKAWGLFVINDSLKGYATGDVVLVSNFESDIDNRKIEKWRHKGDKTIKIVGTFTPMKARRKHV